MRRAYPNYGNGSVSRREPPKQDVQPPPTVTACITPHRQLRLELHQTTPSMPAAYGSVGPVRSEWSPSAVATAGVLHASFSRSEKLTSPNAEIEYCSGLVVATRITSNYSDSYDSLGFQLLSRLCLGQEAPASMHEEFL